MAQETVVRKLDRSAQLAFQARLEGEPFEHRRVPHAVVSVKGEGVVATLYSSGKLVVQGADPETFLARYVGGSGATETPRSARSASSSAGGALVPPGRVVVGCDETGKGDYFGPLVVCALRLEPADRERIVQGGVTDSKKLTDETALRLGPALQAHCAHVVNVLEPPAYNARHAELKNLNPLLADLHAAAIRELAQDGDVVLVDKFANEKLLAERLRGLPIELVQRTRAEREPAVAAASVVARAVFLQRLRALSEEAGVELHKGAGAPTDRAGREYVALHGEDALGRVAKLHFKNTGKILRR